MVFNFCFSNSKRAIAIVLVLVGHCIFPDPQPKISTWIASGFQSIKHVTHFPTNPSAAQLLFPCLKAPSPLPRASSTFLIPTGPWQVCSLGAAAKGSLLTAFLLVLLKSVLIVSLHCLFQAHTHSTFQQLTFAHTGTGWAFCCFFFVVFFLASTCCLILRLSAAVQGSFFLPYLVMHRSVSDHWLEGFTSIHPLLGSGSWAASNHAAAGKCSPPLPEMWLLESAVITLSAPDSEEGLYWCVRRCCANTQILVPHRLP